MLCTKQLIVLSVCELVRLVTGSPLIVAVNRVMLETYATAQKGHTVTSYGYADGDHIEITCMTRLYYSCSLRLQYDRSEYLGDSVRTSVSMGFVHLMGSFGVENDGGHALCACVGDTFVHTVNITFKMQENDYKDLYLNIDGLIIRGVGTRLRHLQLVTAPGFNEAHIESKTNLFYAVLIKYNNELCDVVDMYKPTLQATINLDKNKQVKYCYMNDLNQQILEGTITFEELPPYLNPSSAVVIKLPPTGFSIDKYNGRGTIVYYDYEVNDYLAMACSGQTATIHREYGPECYLDFETDTSVSRGKFNAIEIQLSSDYNLKSFDCVIKCRLQKFKIIRILLRDKHAVKLNATNSSTTPAATSFITPLAPTTIIAPVAITSTAPTPTSTNVGAPGTSTNSTVTTTVSPSLNATKYLLTDVHYGDKSNNDGRSSIMVQWVVGAAFIVLIILGASCTCVYCCIKRRSSPGETLCNKMSQENITLSPVTSRPAASCAEPNYEYAYGMSAGAHTHTHTQRAAQRMNEHAQRGDGHTHNNTDMESHFYYEIDEYFIHKQNKLHTLK